MEKTLTIEQRSIEHPLESVFDIEPGTTVVEVSQLQSAAPIPTDLFDEKDREIEGQFQEVYDAAMTSFSDQAGLLLTSEPKYSARNMEVANSFLNTALEAARSRASLKISREKNVAAGGPKTINNNLIMDRNELLKMLKDAQK